MSGFRAELSRLNGWLYRSGVVLEPLRWWSKLSRRIRKQRPRVSVVIVNWNTLSYLKVTLQAIRRHSPADTEVIVVDNASTDGSRAFLKDNPRVRAVLLPRNLGHPLAMDLGFLLAHGDYLIAMDVDAFPTSIDWIPTLVTPLEHGYGVSGASVRGDKVHPCCLAVEAARFIERRHTFGTRQSGTHGVLDTGELISVREARRYLIERTSIFGPHDIGSVFGDVVYHNFYSARGQADGMYPIPQEEEASGVRARAAEAWREALKRYDLA